MRKIAKFFGNTFLAAAAVMYFVFGALFVSCSDGGGSGGSSVSLKSISLDVADVKTAYISGSDAFTSEGLKVTALYSDKSKKEISAGEYTVTGYEKYADADGVLSLTGDANYVSVKITVEYNGQKASYSIVISKPVSRITVDVSKAVTDFFTDDEISLEAVELAEEGEEQSAGFVVRAFYLNEGDEGYAEEAGEVVTTGVSFTAVDNSVSGTTDVKASYLGKESEAFIVNVYRISGTFVSEFEKGDSVPSLNGIKVYLGDEEVTGAEVVLKDSEGNEYAESVFKVGTYSVVVTAGTAEKTFAEITVNRPDAEKFAVISDESKIEGAALQIRINASDMNVKWAENLEGVKPEVILSDGIVSADPGAFFTDPAENEVTGVVEKFTIQIVLTSPVSTTVADVSADIAGTKYKATVRFANGSCIPSDYVPSSLVLDKTSVELPCAATTTFKVTDGMYGLDYSSDVIWSLEGDSTGSSIENGLFTAGTVDELSTVTVRATLKANSEVCAEAAVTINPDKDDVSSIYDARIYNEENNGAWFHGELSWDDSQYKIVEIKSKSAGIQNIIDVVSAEDKTTFMINLTSGEYRGVRKTFVFRVKTENGAYYDVSVTYTDSNVTDKGSTTSIDEVAVEEAVLNPKLILAKENVEVEKNGTARVAIAYDEILDFDAAKISAASSDDEVVTAKIEGTELVLSWVKDGEATVTVSYDNSVTVKTTIAVTALAGEIVYESLPILPKGNMQTKVEGASVWLYLDNTKLGISGTDASKVEVTVTDTATGNEVGIKTKEFNDYGANTVRLYLVFGAAYANLKVDVVGTFNGKNYKGEAVFKDGMYQFEFVPEALVVSPATKTVETGSEVTFTVKDTKYGVDITDKCTFATDNATVNGNKVTVGDAVGTVTVTVTYNDDESISSSATLNVVEAGSVSYDVVPVLVNDTSIEGNQIFIYLDNSIIKMAVKNKFENEMEFVFTDTKTNEVLAVTPVEYNAWNGDKFRLYATIPSGGHDDATLRITATFGDKSYQSTVTFEGGKAVSNE